MRLREVPAWLTGMVFPTSKEQLLVTLRGLQPQWPEHTIRLGGDSDGGYVVPDDLDGIVACFSPGVGPVADVELHLQRAFDIPSFLADASIDGPPPGIPPDAFTRKFIGNRPGDSRYESMASWMQRTIGDKPGDLILQMDIEGGEYAVIEETPRELLRRFRIVVIEFHGLHKLNERAAFGRFRDAVEKLTQDFRVTHIHPNNAGKFRQYGRIGLPGLLEITFVRNDRHYAPHPHPVVPHRLDRKNLAGKPDIVLPEAWRGAATLSDA